MHLQMQMLRPCTQINAQVDPTLTRADRLVGQVLGEVGNLPDVFTELEINFFLLRRLLGVRTTVRSWDLCQFSRTPTWDADGPGFKDGLLPGLSYVPRSTHSSLTCLDGSSVPTRRPAATSRPAA